VSILSDSVGYGFKTIGVSRDFRIESGIGHLKEIGKFNEISTGSGYKNTLIQKYVWEKAHNTADTATPQVILAKREYKSENLEQRVRISPKIKNETILERKVGIISIYNLSKTIQQF